MPSGGASVFMKLQKYKATSDTLLYMNLELVFGAVASLFITECTPECKKNVKVPLSFQPKSMGAELEKSIPSSLIEIRRISNFVQIFCSNLVTSPPTNRSSKHNFKIEFRICV